MERRDFLKVAALSPLVLSMASRAHAQGKEPSWHEARYYRKSTARKMAVDCRLCPRRCVIPEGDTGFCRARRNSGGKLYSLGYGAPCAVHVDPVEKKPFFNVLPRTYSLSVASAGCNLRCKFCQNWHISQVSPLETRNIPLTPKELVAAALQKDCRSIAYTYTEPTNFYEYMFDTARIAREKGVLNVSHSNGYINQEPLKELCRYMDAVNIDLKGFSSSFYNKLCEGELEPVLETIKTLKRFGVWVEITNLVIPGYNDDQKTITDMCRWICKNAGTDVPVHFSRFHPMYRLTGIPSTPVPTLEKAREAAIGSGIQFAYIGNVPGHPGENTYCPKCRKLLIMRSGYNVLENTLKNGKCPDCATKIGGIWKT